ncbi:MAG: hypothetical protein L0271_01120 [Gemmatimonadetes bacterium]|nr:hypothetical protein [Gemmatimonadota bacterium]
MLDAEFSYEKGEGSVAYDPARTSPDRIIEELGRMTGYIATIRERRAPE